MSIDVYSRCSWIQRASSGGAGRPYRSVGSGAVEAAGGRSWAGSVEVVAGHVVELGF